ncbi:aldo/keto reductase [Iamia majanohamensis]|uniref:Aldo/keto reductase n=1 Tax=Iamia majanohamensis TaxID=467976 RepID=A0AAF0BUX4_9ACTN|nr:aldo/keto reductase [Iamia majanohamensis]WCO68272.1 aldo/keto reductase [Iamia majanohamensis]
MTDHGVTFPGCPTSVAPLGLGTWAWGDRATWGMGGYDTDLTEDRIAEAWTATLDAGVALVDTAEVYGGGESERIIGRLLAADPSRRDGLVLATKFMPLPHKLGVRTALRDALRASIDRLGVERVDLYQLHGPVSLRSQGALAEALAAVVDEGLTQAVGVSNYSVREMERIHVALGRQGVALASNQVEVSLLRRRPDTVGLLDACRRLGVVPLAYSPLGQGRLTGKYSSAAPPPGSRTFSTHPMEEVERVVAVQREVAEAHDRTPAQVALRWLIEHGTVPIPGAKDADQAAQNAGALGWSLTGDERARLDAVALEGTRTLRQRVWQHG